MKKHTIPLLLIISLIYFTTHLYHIDSFSHQFNDESFYQQLSLNIKDGKFYHSNLTNKWYIDIYGLKYIPSEHPPLHFILSSFFINQNLSSARTFIVLLNYISLILIFLILTKLYNENVGLIGTLIWSIYPFGIYITRLNFPHATQSVLILAFIYFTISENIWLSLTSLTLATLTQYSSALLIIPFFIKFKSKSYVPLAVATTLAIPYLWWAIDPYLLQQLAPTLKRFVLIPYIILGTSALLFIVHLFTRYPTLYQSITSKLKTIKQKIPSSLWILLFFYLLFVYLVIKTPNIYDWFTLGLNVFYIGIIGLFLIPERTLLYSYFCLQLYMLILNRGDHLAIIIQPLIIIGFTILAYKAIILYKRPAIKAAIITLLIFLATYSLTQTYAYIPSDSEDITSLNNVINYTNSIITNTTCVMAMTKYSTGLKTNCVSDILLPVAYEYGDAVYRHFPDQSVFNYNISFYNMKYIIAKDAGLLFLKNWGSKTNNSIFLAINEIQSWKNITIDNVTIYINPNPNLT